MIELKSEHLEEDRKYILPVVWPRFVVHVIMSRKEKNTSRILQTCGGSHVNVLLTEGTPVEFLSI